MVNLIKAFTYKELSSKYYLFFFCINIAIFLIMLFTNVDPVKAVDINEAIIIFFIICKISINLNELLFQKIFKNFIFINVKRNHLLLSTILFHSLYLVLLLVIPVLGLFFSNNLTSPIIHRLLLYLWLGIAYLAITTLISLICNGGTESIIFTIICLYIFPPIINNLLTNTLYQYYSPTFYLDPATIFNVSFILSTSILALLVIFALIGINLILKKKEL